MSPQKTPSTNHPMPAHSSTGRLVLALVCLLAWSTPTFAAIALEGSGAIISTTLSATCAGSDRVLYAWSVEDISTDTAHTLVFNGSETMTEVSEISGGRYIALHRLVNPTATTANITVSVGTPLGLGYVCYSGVDTADPDDAPSTENAGGAPATAANGLTISSAVGDIVISGLVVNNKDTAFATANGTGQTERGDVGDTSIGLAISDQTGAASVVPDWSWSVAASFGHIAMNVNVAAGGGGGGDVPSSSLLLLGIGR